MSEHKMILPTRAAGGTMALGETEHTFDFAEYETWMDRFSPLTPEAALSGTSGLYRRLRSHPVRHSGPPVTVAADVVDRLRTGLDTAEDGDELAEVCFRAAGRAGAYTHDDQLALAAALLAYVAALCGTRRSVTPCGSYDAQPRHAHSPGATQSCTLLAAVRTVAR